MAKSVNKQAVERLAKTLQNSLFTGRLDDTIDALERLFDVVVIESEDKVEELGQTEKPVAFATGNLGDLIRKFNTLLKRLKKHGIIQ